MTEKTVITPVLDRPEFSLHIGGQTRTLRFSAAEAYVFEDRLGMDPLGYLAAGKGTTKFCADALFAGLSYDRAVRRELSPGRIFGWLDAEKGLDREEFQKEVLYAVARGKTGEEGIKMVQALDEVFKASAVAGITSNGPGPSSGG